MDGWVGEWMDCVAHCTRDRLCGLTVLVIDSVASLYS